MSYCSKCKGIMMLLVGGAILGNVAILQWDWWTFIGTLFIVMGAVRMAKPTCPCCCEQPQTKKSKKK